jgi:ataxia telangiectasia mutated family protein
MRQHSASLLTILEVIARDPLHKWQAAALQPAAQEEEEEEGEGEEDEADSRHRRRIKVRRAGAASADAERVLLRVRQKLKGNEDPNGEAMSVQGHVKYLINQATDPYNLAVIYHGWSPYL